VKVFKTQVRPVRTVLRNVPGYTWKRVDGIPLYNEEEGVWLPMPPHKEYKLRLEKNTEKK